MSTPTLILGNNKWAIKEDSILGYAVEDRNGLYLPREISFTRASNGTRINSAGLVEVTPWNLTQYSEDFTNGVWVKSRTTITSNATNAPNGTLTADKFIATSASGVHTISQSGFASEAYSFSVYAKAGEETVISLWLRSAAVGATFDLSAGTVSGITVTSATITDVGDGWYRCFVYDSTPGTTVNIYGRIGSPYIGNGVDGFFIWGAQLNIGSTAKPYFQTTDRLNVPRLTYQNGGGGYPSLLLEPQRTNLFPNSQTTANWSFINMSRTANYGISPDGTQNADLLFPTTSGGVSFTSDNTTSSLVIGEPFVVSFFIKLNASFISNVGTNIFDIRLSGASVWSRPTIRVNLETGEVTNQNNASYISSTNFGNGWFRITFGATPTGTSGVVALQAPTGSTMNGGSFYIWGLQGEANATYATSYIPTTSSSATRVADACSKTGISGLIGQTEGTLFAEIRIESGSTEFRVISINDGSISNRVVLAINGQTDIRGFVVYGSTVGTAITTSVPSGAIKIAIVYTATNYTFFVNGSKIGTQTKGSFATTLTNLSFDQGNGGNSFFGQDKQLILFPTPLTDAECQALTTI